MVLFSSLWRFSVGDLMEDGRDACAQSRRAFGIRLSRVAAAITASHDIF